LLCSINKKILKGFSMKMTLVFFLIIFCIYIPSYAADKTQASNIKPTSFCCSDHFSKQDIASVSAELLLDPSISIFSAGVIGALVGAGAGGVATIFVEYSKVYWPLIGAMVVGFGTPAVLYSVGGACLLYKKCSAQTDIEAGHS
jgi:hypothetical protein